MFALLATLQSSASIDWQRWLQQDVRWLIGPNEMNRFLSLRNDRERAHFAKEFWARRDPTPGTARNEFREMHERRLSEANQQFSANAVPGCLTDRGHVYILYGPPDRIEMGAGQNWHYNLIDGLGANIDMHFEDPNHDGNWKLVMNGDETKAIFFQADPYTGRLGNILRH